MAVTDPFCDICCRPKSQHIARGLQCPETTYFRKMAEAFTTPAIAELQAENTKLRKGMSDILDPAVDPSGQLMMTGFRAQMIARQALGEKPLPTKK